MRLGKITIKNNLILAPMLNVSTAPYRRFCRHFGAIGLVSVPMLYSKRLATKPDSVQHDLAKIEQERPISVQLIGPDVESIKKSVEFLKSYDFDILDFNVGCPSRRAINSKEGGYFLGDMNALENILNALVKYSDKPVSIKIRTGLNKSDAFLEIGKMAERIGVEYITIHGRTVKSRYNVKELDLEAIKNLKQSVSIPVVGNGDVFDPEAAKNMLDYTGVDAVMIGRGSIGNPRLFADIEAYLKTGNVPVNQYDNQVLKDMIDVYERFIDDFLSDIKYPHEGFKFVELKRNSIWLSKFMQGSAQFRNELSQTRDLNLLNMKLEEFFDS